jgi:hypothetical protein
MALAVATFRFSHACAARRRSHPTGVRLRARSSRYRRQDTAMARQHVHRRAPRNQIARPRSGVATDTQRVLSRQRQTFLWVSEPPGTARPCLDVTPARQTPSR